MITTLFMLILTFVELNCENLFDFTDDPLKTDEDYTEEGLYHWTPSRYWNKLNHIGQEILCCGERQDGNMAIPDLVALCEVENDSVLLDLTRRSLLRNAGYEYIVTDSPDERGIDVALLYSPLTFSPIISYPIRITPLKDMRPTRDILYVCGRTSAYDTIHVFVVHAPSRYGGELKTRPNRQLVMDRLMQSVDSIGALSPEAHIIVAGDFNEPAGTKVMERIENSSLTDISAGAKGRNGAEGSYKYKGVWESIDHIFVSPRLASSSVCRVGDAEPLLRADEDYGGVCPKRNYWGIKWQDGFSDHLPLVAEFRINE